MVRPSWRELGGTASPGNILEFNDAKQVISKKVPIYLADIKIDSEMSGLLEPLRQYSEREINVISMNP